MRNPLQPISRQGLAVLIALSFAACAQTPAAKREAVQAAAQWQSAAKTDRQEAFVDINSITAVQSFLSATVKYNYAEPQSWAKNKTYSSLESVVRVDCAQQRMADRETRTYAGPDLTGDVVSKASRNEKNLIWYDAVSPTVPGEVLAFICIKGRSAGTASQSN